MMVKSCWNAGGKWMGIIDAMWPEQNENISINETEKFKMESVKSKNR